MKIVFKIIGFLFAALFLISAVLQYNDPDAFVWIFIWGLAAVISILFAFNKAPFKVTLVVGILALIGFFYLYPPEFQGFDLEDGDIKNVELGREAFGLLIMAIMMFVFAFRVWYVRRKF